MGTKASKTSPRHSAESSDSASSDHQSASLLARLPRDVAYICLEYLSLRGLMELRQTCKFLNLLVQNFLPLKLPQLLRDDKRAYSFSDCTKILSQKGMWSVPVICVDTPGNTEYPMLLDKLMGDLKRSLLQPMRKTSLFDPSERSFFDVLTFPTFGTTFWTGDICSPRWRRGLLAITPLENDTAAMGIYQWLMDSQTVGRAWILHDPLGKICDRKTFLSALQLWNHLFVFLACRSLQREPSGRVVILHWTPRKLSNEILSEISNELREQLVTQCQHAPNRKVKSAKSKHKEWASDLVVIHSMDQERPEIVEALRELRRLTPIGTLDDSIPRNTTALPTPKH